MLWSIPPKRRRQSPQALLVWILKKEDCEWAMGRVYDNPFFHSWLGSIWESFIGFERVSILISRWSLRYVPFVTCSTAVLRLVIRTPPLFFSFIGKFRPSWLLADLKD
ncbi:hypothetical protein V6N13_079670 [Hibiscus sabdariffa]